MLRGLRKWTPESRTRRCRLRLPWLGTWDFTHWGWHIGKKAIPSSPTARSTARRWRRCTSRLSGGIGVAYKLQELKIVPNGLNLAPPGDQVASGDCLDLAGWWPSAVGKLQQTRGWTPR